MGFSTLVASYQDLMLDPGGLYKMSKQIKYIDVTSQEVKRRIKRLNNCAAVPTRHQYQLLLCVFGKIYFLCHTTIYILSSRQISPNLEKIFQCAGLNTLPAYFDTIIIIPVYSSCSSSRITAINRITATMYAVVHHPDVCHEVSDVPTFLFYPAYLDIF